MTVVSWVMPSARTAVSSASGERRFQSAGSSSQLVSRYSAPGMWFSAYSSGTPKLTWNRRVLPVGAASGDPPASSSASQSVVTSCV